MSVLAQGKQSIAIGGDVRDSVVVAGNVNLMLGPEAGALLEHLEKSRQPTKQLRPMPLQGGPPPFPDRVDREAEAAAVLDWGEPPRAVNLYGESGIGKSYVLAVAANEPGARALHDGVVSLFAKSLPLQDMLQACFEEFWDCEPPFKASDAEIRRALREREALVVVDSVELPPDEAQALVGAAPGCRFVLASREQTLWDGKAVELAGLPEPDALALFERELGRALDGAERADAAAICQALAGHPLKIRQRAAEARRNGQPLSELRAEVEADGGSRQRLLERAAPEEERVLRLLALLDGASIGEERLAELTGLPNAGEVAARLADKRIVHAHSPRYSVDSGLAGEIASLWPVTEDEEWVLTAVTRWAESNRLEFGQLAEELGALLALFRRAARRPGFEKLVVRLGRAIDATLAWSRRFGAWGEVLAAVLAAAERLGDQAAVAWALHESGVREVALGRVRLGRQQLRKAERIRRSIGDDAGLAATRHNLAVARPRLAFLGPLGVLPLATLPLVILALVLASGGGAAAWFLSHHHHPQRSVVTSATSTTEGTGTTESGDLTLEVELAGKGAGRVTSEPPGIDCPADCSIQFADGTTVTLTATNAEGSKFVEWSGAGAGCSAGVCQVTMSTDEHVVARFEPESGGATGPTGPTTTTPVPPTTTTPAGSSAPSTTTTLTGVTVGLSSPPPPTSNPNQPATTPITAPP
jgi:Divergent InlB B-repeat domain